MKIQLFIYKKKFTITEKEKEEYWRWHELSEPEVTTKENIEKRIEKLRLMVEWTKKIAKKYDEGFQYCGKWNMNYATNEITIL